MDAAQYRQLATREDFAPGWDAIDAAFEVLYPGVTPGHLGTDFTKRAIAGGDLYLDGISFYRSLHGYWHVVTYGMTVLYADEKAFGQEFSGWGYEMTTKLVGDDISDVEWIAHPLLALARRTFQDSHPYQVGSVIGVGGPLRTPATTEMTAYLVVADTEVAPIDTPHGEVEFLQLVGITASELAAFDAGDADLDDFTAAAARHGNWALATDLARPSYF